ncbi:uncharacterized protein LOC118454466 [Neolamprologus brichardi]|uniref:uncharacterized protein LOC118454466 n=1 Tax=Neolamprologus brichardi TaxID=32507 RepID=UPI001643C1B2|nr:uncharacterized protein LOC118454466 [Neolamprologus brichardi]
MAGLWWITVTMIFCLPAGSLAEIDLEQLAGLANQIRTNIRNGYDIKPMYAVAARIPKDGNRISYDLRRVMPNQQTQWNDGILSTPRLVVAQIKRVTTEQGIQYTEHAEWRVLQNLQSLVDNDGDLLVFFSRATPCYEKCANPNGNFRITDRLRCLFNGHEWGEKAFVFNALFKPHGGNINSNRISVALRNIGNSIGRENIFRCYKPDNGHFHCIKCFSSNQIDPNCIS